MPAQTSRPAEPGLPQVPAGLQRGRASDREQQPRWSIAGPPGQAAAVSRLSARPACRGLPGLVAGAPACRRLASRACGAESAPGRSSLSGPGRGCTKTRARGGIACCVPGAAQPLTALFLSSWLGRPLSPSGCGCASAGSWATSHQSRSPRSTSTWVSAPPVAAPLAHPCRGTCCLQACSGDSHSQVSWGHLPAQLWGSTGTDGPGPAPAPALAAAHSLSGAARHALEAAAKAQPPAWQKAALHVPAKAFCSAPLPVPAHARPQGHLCGSGLILPWL